MDKLTMFLKENNTPFDIGIINNGYYHKLPKPFKDKQVIRFKWKKNSINKLLSNLTKIGIILKENALGYYNALYDIEGTNNQVFIIYAVDSHVQLPKLLLKNYRTGDNLFYLNTSSNKIIKSSAGKYNTSFGYYSLAFEEYLSVNYEKIISSIIKLFIPFINQEVTTITLKDLNKNINKLFFMALIRNPKYIKEINEHSLTAQLFDGGYDTEYLAITGEKMNTNFIKGYTPVPLVNTTNKNLVTIKSLVSNLYIDGGIECMVMLLHPKIAIALVPNEYYKKMIDEQGQQTYLQLNEENALIRMNKQIYNCAKFNNDDVIGIKEDLDDLIEYINKQGGKDEHKK